MVQWLGLGAFTAVGLGSIPGRRSKISTSPEMWQKKHPETWITGILLKAPFLKCFPVKFDIPRSTLVQIPMTLWASRDL